jgi:hypothetical protein
LPNSDAGQVVHLPNEIYITGSSVSTRLEVACRDCDASAHGSATWIGDWADNHVKAKHRGQADPACSVPGCKKPRLHKDLCLDHWAIYVERLSDDAKRTTQRLLHLLQQLKEAAV